VFSFFSRKTKQDIAPVTTDVHSHLLAALDDGVKSQEEAEEIINVFLEMGYRKMITTPHILSDYYKNTPETINDGLEKLKIFLKDRADMKVEAAAEYYLDESLMKRTEEKVPLLTFGDRYLLFETNFISEPLQLKEFIFKATSSGYKPVLAHPERYQYMTLAKAEDLRDRGVLLQINSLSLIGYYSLQVQRMAIKLIDQGWIDLLGSDCHNMDQAQFLPQVLKSKHYQKALSLPLLNHSL
jgi:protein-tyrosine phosphatase